MAVGQSHGTGKGSRLDERELGNVDLGGGSTAAVHTGNHQLLLETSALDTLHTCTLHLNEKGKTRLKCWKTHVCLLQLPGN